MYNPIVSVPVVLSVLLLGALTIPLFLPMNMEALTWFFYFAALCAALGLVLVRVRSKIRFSRTVRFLLVLCAILFVLPFLFPLLPLLGGASR